MVANPSELCERLLLNGYIADEELTTALFLGLRLRKPILLEGAPGVGKTEAAKALADSFGRTLMRLQCYEGIDVEHALYEWNYPRQLLTLRQTAEQNINLYTEEFLIERPLLSTIKNAGKYVLLIDEIDRSDHEFEAFLLEFLSDFQISIPELGTIGAAERPIVILTSNRTRQLHEALRRRCFYHWIAYPDADREAQIIALRGGDVPNQVARAVAQAVLRLRALPLVKPPGVSEAIDWARAALAIDQGANDWPASFRRSISAALKDQEDLDLTRNELPGLLSAACA